LYLEADDLEHGIFQSISNIFSAHFDYECTQDGIRRWLRRFSNGTDVQRLLIVVDDLVEREESAALRDFRELAKPPYSDRLILLASCTPDVATKLRVSVGGRKLTKLGERSDHLIVHPLDLQEFSRAESLLAKGFKVGFSGRVGFSPEMLWPSQLRTLAAMSITSGEESQGEIRIVPPFFSLDNLTFAERYHANAYDLLDFYDELVQVVRAQTTRERRPASEVASTMETFVIGKKIARERLGNDVLGDMLRCGFIGQARHPDIGGVITPRFESLFCVRLGHSVADDLSNRLLAESPEDVAMWLLRELRYLPFADVVGAFSIVKHVVKNGGLDISFLQSLTEVPPREEPILPGSRFIIVNSRWGHVEIEYGEDQEVVGAVGGKRVTLNADDFPTYTVVQEDGWLMASHVCGIPTRISATETDDDGAEWLNPALIQVVGSSRYPLLRPNTRGFLQDMPMHGVEGEWQLICKGAGIVEPITFGILKSLGAIREGMDELLEYATEEGHVCLGYRLAVALEAASRSPNELLREWVMTWKGRISEAVEQKMKTEFMAARTGG
jgi:hypothetical protein